MNLPAEVQTLVDQIVRAMGLHAIQPSGLEINMDAQGIVQDVKPKLIYRRGKVAMLPCAICDVRGHSDAPGSCYRPATDQWVCAGCMNKLDKREKVSPN